jgi:ferritin-like metal-binding protein YciE
MNKVQDLLLHEMQDIYDAEQQLVKALPKMAQGANSQELTRAFEQHLEVTKSQVKRLESAFKQLDKPAKAEHCDGMAGLIKEGEKALKEDMASDIKDMALMGAAARVEHYEMAAYTAAITLAEACGENEVVELLRASLEEEQQTAEQLESSLESNSGASGDTRRSMQSSRGSRSGNGSSSHGEHDRDRSTSASTTTSRAANQKGNQR